MNKFANMVQDYIDQESFKLQVRYKTTINFDILFMISLYKKIEKRGFRIVYEVNKKEITPTCGFVANILMY